MKYKKVTMVINQKDIRQLLGNSLSHILNRHIAQHIECIEDLNTAVGSGIKEDVLECLKKLLGTYSVVAAELDTTAPLILELESSISADTEVLENLPNLEENSLGVNSGGE
jgi:hypothetical protein